MRREVVPDQAIAAVAARQGGVIARSQLSALGLSASAIDRRVRCCRLPLLHRGVYAVGHRVVGVTGRRWAAVPACGEGAVLSHIAAGSAWAILRSSSAVVGAIVSALCTS